MKHIYNTIGKYILLFVSYASVCFILASLGYWMLHLIMPHGYVFGAFYRMFLYHSMYPEQYIAIISMTYGISACIWTFLWGESKGITRYFSIIVMMGVAVIIASPFGGVLWVIHDMQAGFFPNLDVMINHLWWGVKTGLEIGWLIILLSIPYNVLGIICGIFITDIIQKYFSKRTEHRMN